MRESRSLPSPFGIVGVGQVGLRLGLAAVESGYEVRAVDSNPERVATLQRGISPVLGVRDAEVASKLESGLNVDTEYEVLGNAAHVAVCVPTSVNEQGGPDLSNVVDAVSRLTSTVTDGTNIIIESTLPPGTTTERILPMFEAEEFEVGRDIYLAYSPERIDPGNQEYGISEVPKVIAGVTTECERRTRAAYSRIFDELVVMESPRDAEMVKVFENAFRNVNIALVNELAKLANKLEVPFWDVIEAAATKPYGFMPFYPGPGVGGQCVPVDPQYLAWQAHRYDQRIELVERAVDINRAMPDYVVSRLRRNLQEVRIPLSEADILILGLTYKRDTADIRNVPARQIINQLESKGTSISYHDPFVAEFTSAAGIRYESEELTEELLEGQDCILILTDHSSFDVSFIVEHSNRILDTRNATSEFVAEHIERL